MDVTAVHLLPECYRGSSPRSASTPGPAPDSPASASGRFSASPLLSPFPYYSHLAVAAAAAHGTGPLGLIGGLGASFLSSNSLLTPYGLGLGLHNAMAQLPAGLSSPPSSLTSLGHLQRLQQLQLPSPAGTHSAPSRALPFSVENILKPEFGHKNGVQPQAASPAAADVKKCDAQRPASPNEHKAIKRPLEPATCKVESRGPSSPKIKCSDDKLANVKPDPVDLSSNNSNSSSSSSGGGKGAELPTDPTKMTDPSKWPAWIFCTRYSDRPSSGPRSRRIKKDRKVEEKRPRTAFTAEQLAHLKKEFNENRYLNEKRRQDLARELGLHENQIKIWFQNKRAKIKKTTGQKNPLALQLMAQGLYNHTTVPIDEDEEEEFRQQSSD